MKGAELRGVINRAFVESLRGWSVCGIYGCCRGKEGVEEDVRGERRCEEERKRGVKREGEVAWWY